MNCRCVELRALCDEVPRTPPGPEGSNGTGIASCAAEYPKFLSSDIDAKLVGKLQAWFLVTFDFLCDFCVLLRKNSALRTRRAHFTEEEQILKRLKEFRAYHELSGHRAKM